jgi:hypothetical protein
MAWLKGQADAQPGGWRVFGIQPDYGAVAGLQDIEAVGPLATNEYLAFVGAIGTSEIADALTYGSTFSLVRPHAPELMYDLAGLYPRARPILDWLGVRFLVLDHRVFGTPAADWPNDLVTGLPEVTPVYVDDHVTILQSGQAASKAMLALAARPAASPDEALDPIRADPTAIGGAVQVEAPPDALGSIPAVPDGQAQIPVPLSSYRPNEVAATFDAPMAGVFVVKDSYFPGWSATLDGRPTTVVRVDGLVRGVIVPGPGRHTVTMRYLPASFTIGLGLGAAAALVLIALVILERRRAPHSRRSQMLPPGFLRNVGISWPISSRWYVHR